MLPLILPYVYGVDVIDDEVFNQDHEINNVKIGGGGLKIFQH